MQQIDREIQNAKRQLAIYDEELRQIEFKALDLDSKNTQYNSDLSSITKQVIEKEKEVEQVSSKIRSIRREHGGSDAKFVKKLEDKVRNTLKSFFQSCKNSKFTSRYESESGETGGGGGAGIGTLNSASTNQKTGGNEDLFSSRTFINNKLGMKSTTAIPSSQQVISNKHSSNSKERDQQSDHFDFQIKVINGQQINDVPINLSVVQNVLQLRTYLAYLQKDSLFLFDESGNILLDEMNLEQALFPNVFRSIKMYIPTLRIEVKRTKNAKFRGKNDNDDPENLLTIDDINNQDGKKTADKKMTICQKIVHLLPKILNYTKHIFENLAILILIILFITDRYASDNVINKFNLSKATEKNLQAELKLTGDINDLTKSFASLAIDTIIKEVKYQTAYKESWVVFTALMPSLIVQTRITKKSECNIPEYHANIYGKNRCVNLNEQSYDQYGTEEMFQYKTLDGQSLEGFFLRIPEDLRDMSDSRINLIKTQWIDPQTESLTMYLNHFNSRSSMVIQNKISVKQHQTDGTLQLTSIATNAFSVESETYSEKLSKDAITIISAILLLFAFVEYVGVYGAQTSNITVMLYKQRQQKIAEQNKLEAHDQQEFEKNFGNAADSGGAPPQKRNSQKKAQSLEDHQYRIIDLNWLFILIKRPVFFDIINIISLVLLIVQSGILGTIRESRVGLIRVNEKYQHFDDQVSNENTINTMTAVNVLLLMLSFTKYLASWSFTLKIYSQVMTTFAQNAWGIVVVIFSVIFVVSFSWMTFINSTIQYHNDFVYSILVQIKATFYSSYLQDLRESTSNLPELPPLVKDSVYSVFVVIAMLVVQIMIHFGIFAFLSSLMTHNIHATKERMEQIKKEIKDFEKRKVVNTTTFFRQSIMKLEGENDAMPGE